MPRKRPAENESRDGGNRKAKATDWREPLYFLHGEVTTEFAARRGEEVEEVTVWRGTWLASENGLPSIDEFNDSGDSFSLTTAEFLGTGVPLEEHCPIGRSGGFKGLYTMADGRTFQDYDHKMVIMDHTASCSLVAERGTSALGEYVSLGRLTHPREGKNTRATLTLARRYLENNDPRASAALWTWMAKLGSQVTRDCREQGDFAPHAPAPWRLPAMEATVSSF